MNEPTVNMASEQETRFHWFTKFFYRKEGYKLTLIPSRYYSLAVLLFALSYGAFLFQNPTSTKSRQESSFSSVQNVPPMADHAFAGNALESAHEKKGKEAIRHGKKVLRPAYLGPQIVSRPVLTIPEGTLFAAKLITGASNGPIRAVVPKRVSIDGETLIDVGTVLVGTGTSGEDRLDIHFSKMVFRDGKSQNINATAYDPGDKMPGLKGSRLGNQAVRIAGSVGLNFVGGMSEGLEETSVQGGVGVKPSTLKNALLNGASRTAIEESQNVMSSLKNERPVVVVGPGKEILVSFEGNQNE